MWRTVNRVIYAKHRLRSSDATDNYNSSLHIWNNWLCQIVNWFTTIAMLTQELLKDLFHPFQTSYGGCSECEWGNHVSKCGIFACKIDKVVSQFHFKFCMCFLCKIQLYVVKCIICMLVWLPEMTEAQQCVANSNSELAVLSVMPNVKWLGNMLV